MRTLIGLGFGCIVLTLLLQFAPSESPALLACKLIVAVCAAGLLPGALLVLAVRPLRRLTLLELLGIGTAVSLALSEVLTVISLSTHVGMDVIGRAVLVGCAGLGAWSWSRAANATPVRLPRSDILLLLLLVPLAVLLYSEGSPFDTGEDGIHVSIVRRLTVVPQPSLTNIYYATDFVYTYPFPGTHFFFALVSSFASIDPLFVYHKMRAALGPMSIIFLFLLARYLFGSQRIAMVTALTAIVLVFNGAFAVVPGFSWGQLVPYSHASDVAMNVVLPGLLVLASQFVLARTRRSGGFFLFWTLATVFQLSVVHVRELVQFLVYGVSWAVSLLVLRRSSAAAGERVRSVVLVVASIAVAGAYLTWYRLTVGHIDVLVDLRRADLVELVRTTASVDFFLEPLKDGGFGLAYEYFMYGWTPLALLAGPVLLLLLPRKRPGLLIASSVTAYLLILRFALLSVPYVYLTYFEILYTPVRNVVFFMYLVVGAAVYMLMMAIGRIRHVPLQLLVVGVLAILGRVYWSWTMSQVDTGGGPVTAVLLLALVLYGLAFALYRNHRLIRWVVRLRGGSPRRLPRVALGALLVALAAVSFVSVSVPGSWMDGGGAAQLAQTEKLLGRVNPALNDPGYQRTLLDARGWVWFIGEPHDETGFPVKLPAPIDIPLPLDAELSFRLPLLTPATLVRGWLATPDTLVRGQTCPVADTAIPAPGAYMCFPDFDFVDWSRRQLSLGAVLATDGSNGVILPEFIPQQVVSPPNPRGSIPALVNAFPHYYELYFKAVAEGRTQPFFDPLETAADREAFLTRLHVTHVVLTPLDSWLQPVLSQMPRLTLVYDRAGWVVFEVSSG